MEPGKLSIALYPVNIFRISCLVNFIIQPAMLAFLEPPENLPEDPDPDRGWVQPLLTSAKWLKPKA
jgi:hypothetical protein